MKTKITLENFEKAKNEIRVDRALENQVLYSLIKDLEQTKLIFIILSILSLFIGIIITPIGVLI